MRHDDTQPRYNCFRCRGGAVHIVCGNTMVMLTPDQFLALAEAVKDMQRQIQEEAGVSTALTYTEQIVM
ncbi:MAG: hypothetical protein AB1631_12245 [Acidobacteriota bacterium]